MIPVEPYGAVWEWHSVVMRGSVIEAVLPTEDAGQMFPQASVVDLREHVLLPGLVNAHTHAAMALLRGFADDMPLKQWLETRIWPAEAELANHEFVADGTRLACLEMVQGGITAFADMYFYADEAIRAAISTGMRINSGLLFMTVPTGYARTEAEYLDRGMLTRSVWADHELVDFSLAPHATYSTTPHGIGTMRDLQQEHGFGVHTHLHETAGEVAAERQQYGASGVQRLQQAGVLGPGFFGAHAVHVDAVDVQILAEAGASVVHCPSSNMKLASGFAPVGPLVAAGVNVALGTDGAASNNRIDLWQEMRTAALLTKAQTGNPAALPAHSALHMATLAGARALGMGDRVGSLTVGKQADIVAVDLGAANLQPVYDPASHLVYVTGRENVSDVWVAGKRVVAEHTCTTADPSDVLAQADEWVERLRHR